jgi:hypothetical protein
MILLCLCIYGFIKGNEIFIDRDYALICSRLILVINAIIFQYLNL